MARFISLDAHDVRFPTSRDLDGSDAMNPDPDYSAAYVVLRTDAPDGLEGHGLVFTIGRGNDVQVSALNALAGHVVGRDVESTLADLGGFGRDLTGDSQLRWLGPEKGVMHMAIGAVVNAMWDLSAKRERKPLWLLLSEMSPTELVDLVDFRYLTDALTRAEALTILEGAEPGRVQRIAELRARGYPAYTTSPGWLGYADEKLERLCLEAAADGFGLVKLKVGASLEDDIRRLGIARAILGPAFPIAIDANQRWDVPQAKEWIRALAEFDPWWVEEPTSPDEVLGHASIRQAVSPVRIATGEHVQNRVVFKQLMQAEAIDIVQVDACRMGGVNEILAVLLLAAKFGLPVCPHAGGVGLCELVQHFSMFDLVAVSGRSEGRAIEFVDHLHEHFVDPVVVENGVYRAPRSPGSGAAIKPGSLREFSFPHGPAWATVREASP